MFEKENMRSRPKCGEIWLCDLEQRKGSVQNGYRPVFVLSNDVNNTFSPTINIIPITSKNKHDLPVHVKLDEHEKYGLCLPSTMLIEQITTIPADNMDRRIGEIKDRLILGDIYKALAVQFPIVQLGDC